jgi:hypothetical protein
VALITLTMLMAAAVPAGAGSVEDPTTPFSDEFDATTDLSLYIFNRYKPSRIPFYEPTPTEGTYDGRSVGILRVDGNRPMAGHPDP